MQEPNGFGRFVAEQQPVLLRMTRALTGDEQLAEDLAQVSLERLWRRWDQIVIHQRADPTAYLRRIVVSVYATWWRRRWRGEIATGSLPDVMAADNLHDQVESADTVARWLRGLPHRQRLVIVLRFLADLSVAETAATLQCSEGTVKSQTSKALVRLREDVTLEREGTS